MKKSRPLFWVLWITVLSEALFLWNIEQPAKYNFDEVAYIPAAKGYLSGQQFLNREHPPLGKELMAVGIRLGGDRPLGWRIMSTVFGALSVAAFFVWAYLLFGNSALAAWVALLTLFNQMVYVQARIATLDIFLLAFLSWAMVALLASTQTRGSPARRRLFLYLAGLLFGCAVAAKWSAIMPWLGCLALALASKSLGGKQAKGWLGGWHAIPYRDFLGALLLAPLLTYFSFYAPLFSLQNGAPQSWGEVLELQSKMWLDHANLTTPHGYSSHWYEWPLIRRPIWYLFAVTEGPPRMVRPVVLLGNPWVLWTGLGAVFWRFWRFLRGPTAADFWILFSFAAFYLPWAVLPKPTMFAYYYMPAACVLSLALAASLRNTRTWILWGYLLAAAAFFVYFFPVSSAMAVPFDSYRRWIWFRSWL